MQSPPARHNSRPSDVPSALFKRCLLEADELKHEGNEHFRAKHWDEALVAYRAALGRLPKRKSPAKVSSKSDGKRRDDDGAGQEEQASVSEAASSIVEEPAPSTALEIECAKARSVLNANIGACHVKLVSFFLRLKS